MGLFRSSRFLAPALALGVLALPNVACSDDAGPASAEAARVVGRTLPAPAEPAATADEAVMRVARAVADGDLHVAWDALPGSYQRDVTRIVHTFGAKMDAEVWNKSFDVLRRFGVLLDSKKQLILAMPNFQDSPDFDVDEASAQWDHVVSIFSTIASSEIASVESLQRIDVRHFLGTTGSALMADVSAMSEIAEGKLDGLHDLRTLTATLERSDGDFAVVVMEIPGQSPMTEEFARVEGKWIPKELADEWEESVAEALASLEALTSEEFQENKADVMQVLIAIDGVIDQLHAARTPEEFEQGLQQGMFQVFGVIMSISRTMQSAG